MKKLLLGLIFLSTTFVCVAQSEKGKSSGTMDSKTARLVKTFIKSKQDGKTKVTDKVAPTIGGGRFVQPVKPIDPRRIVKIRNTEDSVFYLNVTKRNGWPEGIGKPLAKKDLSHIPVYYVLSNKNKAGKWTFMRAFDAYGHLTTNHSWGTYIVNPNDEEDKGANTQWADKLKTVCQWQFIGDTDEQDVVQERALDENKNIVFCYNIVKVSENKRDGSSMYAGSYTDAFALPIFMRTDSTGNYKGHANFVQVKRDKRGYETLFAFTDETGRIRLNKDGAYQTRKDYDDKGCQIREASLDLFGNQMIDYYGNCGWQNTVDDYGCILSAKYFGANNEPIRMPGTRGSEKIYGYEFAYDEYHREKDRWYLVDSLGTRGSNEYGVCHSVTEYNNHGERRLVSYYDEQKNLVGNDQYGIAQMETKYDDKGNLLTVEWRNKDGKLTNGYGDYCQRDTKYDEKGNIIAQTEYIKNENDSTLISFQYETDSLGNEIHKWNKEGYYRVDSVDSKGRATLEAWYDLNGKPIASPVDKINAWHKYKVSYNDDDNTETQEWIDSTGAQYCNNNYDLSNKYNLSINQTDYAKKTVTNTQYLKPYGLIQKFVKEFDDQNRIVAQWDVTPYGEHARVGWWNNLYYRCNVTYNMYGEMKDMLGVNEFNEPSYLVSLNDDGEVYHYNDLGTYYDVHSRVIPADSMEVFKERLPKAFCIEVTDTAIAYPLGLRNGDIILSYGNWATCEDLRSNLNYFYLETILKNAVAKKVAVLRHNVQKKTSSIMWLELPKGKPSELGFYPHMIYYTEKEALRLHNTCSKYSFAYGKDEEKEGKQVLMGVQLKGGLIQTRFYHFLQFNYKDPGFLLYASEKYSKGTDTWSVVDDDVETWTKNVMFNSAFSGETELYLTQDFENVKKLSKSSSGNRGLRIVPITIPVETYNKLTKCYFASPEISNARVSLMETMLNKAVSTPTTKIKTKKLVGSWTASYSEDGFTLNIEIALDKDNYVKVKTLISAYGEISEGDTLSLQATSSATGTWSISDGLTFEYDEETKSLSIDSIDIISTSESRRQQLLNELNQSKSELVEMLAGEDSGKFLPTSLLIKDVRKKTMHAIMGENKELTFIKQE